MTLIVDNKVSNISTPYIQRKIRCLGHYLIPPQIDIYMREPVQELKNCHDFAEWKGVRKRIKKMRIMRDAFGRKKIDWRKLIELRNKGIIIQPWVTASWAIEHVYDPLGQLCIHCDKRCLEGKGRILTRTIKRLNVDE